MGMQSVLIVNDEAHHCYRHKVSPNGAAAEDSEEGEVEPDEAEEAKKNTEAARLWNCSTVEERTITSEN
jgi:type III restriction enzyme